MRGGHRAPAFYPLSSLLRLSPSPAYLSATFGQIFRPRRFSLASIEDVLSSGFSASTKKPTTLKLK
ncbi:hypothetical protein BURKHO8Y_120213 [Burkholderia sp. 8Y]|nr:hypothetical protein BURKHO8Y_120213 [Burkholderia sp. 8Y]